MARPVSVTVTQIRTIRKMRRAAATHDEISAAVGVSVCTVRRYLRLDPKQREAELYRLNVGRAGLKRSKTHQVYVSPIDGEKLVVMVSGGYLRLTSDLNREHLHVYEAKKVYRLLGLPWKPGLIVHHIDLTRANAAPTNLSVLPSVGEHRQLHNQLEQSMYAFLQRRGLLAEFYRQHPQLCLVSLADQLKGLKSAKVRRGKPRRVPQPVRCRST